MLYLLTSIILLCLYGVFVYLLPLTYARRISPKLRKELAQSFEGQDFILSFDDGPSEITPYLLELLKQHQQRAYFFVVGKQLEQATYAHCIQAAYEQGHLIGIHAYQHRHFFSLIYSYLDLKRVYLRCLELGISPTYLRAPHGFYNLATLYFAARYKLRIIHWDALLHDWEDLSLRELYTRFCSKLKYTQIHHELPCVLVLHDGKAGAAHAFAYQSSGLTVSYLLTQGVLRCAKKAPQLN